MFLAEVIGVLNVKPPKHYTTYTKKQNTEKKFKTITKLAGTHNKLCGAYL